MEQTNDKNKVKSEMIVEKEKEEKVESKDASLTFIVFILNIALIGVTAQSAMTKDMFMYRGVKIYEFVFFRSFFNMCSSAIIIK